MRCYVIIPLSMQDQLCDLAQREYRTPRQQVWKILEPALRAALEREGEQRQGAEDREAVGQAHTGTTQAREAP